MTGIILAAGNGTRLKESSGENCCKVLKKVNGISLIEFALNNLVELNVANVFIVVGLDGELIKKTLGNIYKCLKITYIYQSEQIGLINALMQAIEVAESDDIILQLADEIFISFRADEVRRILSDDVLDFGCGITCEDDLQKIKANYSIETDCNMVIEKCTEKPEHITNNLKGTGLCVFKKDVIDLLKEVYDKKNNTPNDLCDFVNCLVAEKRRGAAFCVADKEFNINTIEDLTQAIEFLS